MAFDRAVLSHLQVTNPQARGLGPHTLTLRNTSALTLRIEPRLVDEWPRPGNGIDAELGPMRLEPNARQDFRYTIRSNDTPGNDPFRMTRSYELRVWLDGSPEVATTVPLVLSATLDPAELLRVKVPTVGPSGSYVCAAAELEHVPRPLWPVHCRNFLSAAQAGSYPLELYFGEADPLQHAYLRRLQLDQLYRTRYPDGSVEPLNCAASCTVDFAHGRHVFNHVPTRPGLGYVLEPLVEGLPRISRRMRGDEPDVVLEVERRVDLMDPTTRVDTIQAVCIGDDCGSGTIVIDSIERIDDVGHGFEPPPGDEMRRYAPDGALSPGTTLSPAGPRDRAELAWRITEGGGGSYVESHYEIRYHGSDGRQRSYESTHFGGILEPLPPRGRAGSFAPPGAQPPWWAREQLLGPFARVDVADASLAPRSAYWATPTPASQARLISALLLAEGMGRGSGTVVGLPKLRSDRSVESFKVLTALHLLIPLLQGGLTLDEFLGRYDAPLEVVLSEAWFDDAVDSPDPSVARLPDPQILGRRFHSMVNAVFEVSAPTLPAAPEAHIPDVMLYTVHPTEHLVETSSAQVGAPVLLFPIPLGPRVLNDPTSMVGYPALIRYPVTPPGSPQIVFEPMVVARFPGLRSTVSVHPKLPFNTRNLLLGVGEQFRYALLDPATGEEALIGSDEQILYGLSGAAVLTDAHWEDGVLKRAVVRGVQSSWSRVSATGEMRMHYIGLDVDPLDQQGLDYHAWLLSHLP